MKPIEILNKIDGLQQIIEHLETQIHFSSNSSFPELINELNQLKLKLKLEKFYLVLIGMFKRGKSFLANALIGKEVVPSSILPLTSIVTLIEFCETDHIEIFFKSGEKKIDDLNSIYEYVTEQKNPINKKNVDFVRVCINSDFLKKITIVDTPGIGSTFDNNTETTYRFVERIDAALFILSADLPISKTEVEFLQNLKNNVPKIVFVMNKIDLLSSVELKKIISFNSNILKEILNQNDVKILPVSAKLALEGISKKDKNLISESGINNLLQEINQILAKEKQEVILISAKNTFISIINNIDTILNIRLQALLTPIEKLNYEYQSFLNSLEIMKKDKIDFEILINGKIKQLQEYVTDYLYNLSNNLIKSIDDTLIIQNDDLIDELIIGGIDEVHKKYLENIEELYSSVKTKLEQEVIERFRNILIEYSKGSNLFLNELAKNFSLYSIFDFSDLISSFDLNILTSFYFKFEKYYNPFYLQKENLKKIIIRLFKRRIAKKLKENLKQNIDMNIGRINYDINYKIQESFRKFNALLNTKVNETINMLNKIIFETIRNKEQTESIVQNQIQSIREIINKLYQLRLYSSNGFI